VKDKAGTKDAGTGGEGLGWNTEKKGRVTQPAMMRVTRSMNVVGKGKGKATEQEARESDKEVGEVGTPSPKRRRLEVVLPKKAK
jgi:hypothetical protein